MLPQKSLYHQRLILQRLQIQEAQRSGIRVDDQTLNQTISRIAESNGLNLKQFKQVLERDGYSFSGFREDVRNEILVGRVRNSKVKNRIKVSEQEIDHLLETVAGSGCIFIRNGKEHNAEAARDHLALKRRKGKRYYSNTEEFIEKLASSSSWSGKPYRIRCGDDEVLAATWFTDTLSAYRAEPR